MGLGPKNQFILVKTIKFSVLVPQKLSVESSTNKEKKPQNNEKSTFTGGRGRLEKHIQQFTFESKFSVESSINNEKMTKR